ncbi:unnamed protein product [Rotaria magnacalcarata]|uniref:G-protein coupled receptors family 1 profile domain-containing protein n=1 Tax=Rotaria magnacalcarata TaxID=392030 RepID=A0A816HDZ7_9BILA|nr:unnamed protein product [Rotaria magnacalcarata]CAF1685700.1 unnamed protein product [Rotaria magnacalcarata]CAF2163571.1 unnamed protein product [Rotaria magnacalcarata]CAF4133163.1 unnamed protein product [Rotaria magnacalcarata]CAF4198295.1 unnamed protein product [Rotaria magnacalcarata]
MPSTAATANTVSRWLNYLVALPMVILGTFGAILTIIIFTRRNSFLRNPTVQYLLAGAVMTALHLPSVYLQGILVDGFGLGIYNTNIIVCREHRYLFYSTTVATISFPCWAAFDQYVSTSREATVRRRWSSIRMTRFVIVGTIIFWSIVYMPIIFIVSIASGSCAFIDSPLSRLNDYFVTPVAYTIAPLTVVIICMRGIIRNLQSNRVHNHNNNLKIQVRRMLIPQLIILSISGVPFGLYSIYTQATSKTQKDASRLAIEHLFLQIIRLFYHLNFVCSFYTYFYRSKEMRKVLKRLIYGLIRRNQIEPADVSLANTFSLNTVV